jgi:hypothetical protein
MPSIRNLTLLSALAVLGLSACAPSENYDANGNYKGASDHGGGYQAPVSDDDHYYHSGDDNSENHHKHNTISTTPMDSSGYDHNNDPDSTDASGHNANGW